MSIVMKSLFGLLVGTALAGAAVAAELVGRAPFEDSAFGQQSDAAGPAYTQSFVAPGGTVLEAIRWWGFHGPNSLGSSFDNFVVMLDGVAQVGSLSVASISPFFDEYTLDVSDAALTATSLSILNDSGDVEWFWQSAEAIGNPNAPDATDIAFSLIGRSGPSTVDEPAVPALILAALAAVVTTRARRRRLLLQHSPSDLSLRFDFLHRLAGRQAAARSV